MLTSSDLQEMFQNLMLTLVSLNFHLWHVLRIMPYFLCLPKEIYCLSSDQGCQMSVIKDFIHFKVDDF